MNAALNASAAICLFVGWRFIRHGRKDAHRLAMTGALLCSALFLVSYLYYHYQVGSVRFTGQGPIRVVYFSVLITHTVGAVAILPLVVMTLVRALKGRFAAHRAIARITLPLWAWVSLSGVVVYWMLYRL